MPEAAQKARDMVEPHHDALAAIMPDADNAVKSFQAQLEHEQYGMPAPLQNAAPSAQLANAYTQGFAAGTGKVLQSAGVCFKSGYDLGFKESQVCFKAGYCQGNEADATNLKRKCKLILFYTTTDCIYVHSENDRQGTRRSSPSQEGTNK